MTKRVRRTRLTEMDEQAELVARFSAVLREDPWYDALPMSIARSAEEANLICWHLVAHLQPDLQFRGQQWSCTGHNKFGFGDGPREALMRWYISVRAGMPTVTELMEEANEETKEGEGEGGDGAETSEVPQRVEKRERRRRRSRSKTVD